MPLLDPAEAPWTSEGEEFYSDLRQKIAIRTSDDIPVFDESIFDDIKLQSCHQKLLQDVINSLQKAVLVCDEDKVPISEWTEEHSVGSTYAGCTGWSRQTMNSAILNLQSLLSYYS
jgi:hypothetical protein